MLPFLKHKKEAAIVMPVTKHVGDTAPLAAAAADLLKAIENKDESAIAAALKSAFRFLDSQPHEEGEHTEPSEESAE